MSMLSWLKEKRSVTLPRWVWFWGFLLQGISNGLVYQMAEHDWIGKVLR